MTTYILKRLLLMPPMLLGITMLSFLVIILAPGTSGAIGGGDMSTKRRLTQQQLEVLKETFHVGEPWYKRYCFWLGVLQPAPSARELAEAQESGTAPPRHGILFGDFGKSVTTPSITVAQKLKEAIPITILLSFIAIFVEYLVSIPLGIFSATHQHTRRDTALTIVLFVLYSLPSFWVAILLIKLMVTMRQMGLPHLPFQGILPSGSEDMSTFTLLWECTQRLFLPVLASCYASLAGLSRFMRVGMIDIIRSDFIRTARAKGCPERTVVYKHALRNSLIPVITIIAGLLPGLIGGSVIIETIFGIQGMGYLGYTAVLERDYTVLMADLTIAACLTLFGILLSDLLYVVVDPRISFDRGR